MSLIGVSMLLTRDNFEQGFLLDATWMGGVAAAENQPGFLAYIVDLESGESLGAHSFPTLDLALDALNSIPRPWAFSAVSSCGSGDCSSGSCAGSCPKPTE